jgi:LuxR family transcriptional regulator, maltose regulon positive regulatory protein
MRIQQSSHKGCVVLTLAGRLNQAAAPQLQRAILKQLAEHPPAIICDLGQVEAIDPLCARVFTTIRHPALGWPGTALVLCAVRPQVAEVLLQLGVARFLAIYPSLDQALANARARPPRLSERLALGPVPTAAGAGRAFVGEVCGRWGLGGLAGSAALVASELVTNAVVHARTALELRVELRGPQLRVAVRDRDPNLARVLVAKEGTGRGLGLGIVERVATAWGVRQEGAGGKTVWCTLDLPPQDPDTEDRNLQPPADSGVAAMNQVGRRSSDAMRPPGPELVLTKLWPPTTRAGLLPRADLQALLQAGLQGRLCLVGAPAGFGKTTLLTQWRAVAGASRVAWVSLEEADNDPTRFWVYVVEALRTVEPGVGAGALAALGRPSADLQRTVLPGLLNELSTAGLPLYLVLDDFHLITNPTCHQTLTFFLDHLPADIHVVLATRADPPLPLARMRARGELAELRATDLQFTDQEASELLNGSMGLRLDAGDVGRLAERTEGWAAGLYLAGLSLRGREDARGFIASFQGNSRHVADYLGAEVLASQPEAARRFLLRTSVLERLSGPLCDAVLEADGSAGLLVELERSNLFLVPLDDRREWYRYHHLFAELLRAELADRDPELLPTLHRRAAAWHERAGNLEEAIGHASAAGDFAEAAELIGRHWLTFWRRGQGATVARWLDGFPYEAIMANPPVAYSAVWIRGCSGASKEETEGWLAAAEGDGNAGALPDGVSSMAFAVNLARAMLLFDDVGRSVEAACRALELADPDPSPSFWMAQMTLGQALYLSGESVEAQPRLEELVGRVSAAEQPYAVVVALAVLSLAAGDREDDRAAALAHRAAVTAEAQGLSASPLCAIAYLAVGRALTRQGELAGAEEQLGRALELLGIDSMLVLRAFALLLLASVRRGRGDLPGARGLVERARELIERSVDPGSLPALLSQTERLLASAPRRRVELATPLTERELAVLRLLPTHLSALEIGRELYVSVNTVRSHVQAVYRKLGVATRAEAVAQARELGLLPGVDGHRPQPLHPG